MIIITYLWINTFECIKNKFRGKYKILIKKFGLIKFMLSYNLSNEYIIELISSIPL